MFSEVFTKVRDGEIDFPVSTILDYLRLNEVRAVDAGVFHVLAHAFGNGGGGRRSVILRHCQKIGFIDGRKPIQFRSVDCVSQTTERILDPGFSIFH